MTIRLDEAIVGEFARLVEPIVRASADEGALRDLLAEIGWNLAAIPDLPAAQLASLLGQLVSAYDMLVGVPQAPTEGADAIGRVLGTTSEAFQAVRRIATLLDGPNVTRPPQFERIGQELIEYLTTRYLFVHRPTVYAAAELLTLIESSAPDDATPTVVDPVTRAVIRYRMPRRRVRFDRLGDVLADPVAVLKREYVPSGKLTDDADVRRLTQKLFPRLAMLLLGLRVRAAYEFQRGTTDLGLVGNAVAEDTMGIVFSLPPLTDGVETTVGALFSFSPESWGNLGLVVTPFGSVAFKRIIGQWDLDLALDASIQAFAVGPAGFALRAAPQTTRVDAILSAGKVAATPGEPAVVLGHSAGTRLEIGELLTHLKAGLSAGGQDLGVLIEARQAAIVIAPASTDGFLASILPPRGLAVKFDLGIGWSNAKGLYFSGAAGLEATLPINLSVLGVLEVNSVYLALQAAGVGVRNVAALTITLQIGPVSVMVERFGLEALLAFPQGGGNLGVADLAFRFKPPSGAALAIKGPGVEGGGYLFFDPQKEQYAGIVQLSLADTVAVKGVGLLTTRMPDGSKGFSLLVIISAEGFSPIPLGFGFTLTGIGGLLGINRTAAVDTLRRALKTGALESVLFPADPVRDAPRVVSDAAAVFPPAPGRHVFGPMAKICWGTPTILTLNLGLVLETPEPVRLLVLGRAVAVLPEEKNALIAVRMDALGVIDFATGEIALDAVLYDSRIASFALTGDMALRANWGANPNFLLAIGGFNPRFPAPPGFPALARLALALSGDDPNARLRMEAYLAITSNTVQFGARLDFYFTAPPFSLEGRLSFDTLFHFAPFSFVADLAAQLALRQDGALLTSVALTMSLSGPAPWHAWGTGQFVVAGVKQSFVFDARYGAGQEPALPAPVDVKTLLVAALTDARNWSGELPAEERPLVTVRSGATAAVGLRVHPLARVAVRERIAPLEMKIGRFGNAPVSGENQFVLAVVRSDTGASVATAQKLTDAFALAQFSDLSDDQKLALPAFTQQPAGLRIGARDVAYGYEPALDASLVYETLVIAPDLPAQRLAPYVMPAAVLDSTIAVGAAAQAARRAA